jgi:AmiR/NasT family two-component response regulator
MSDESEGRGELLHEKVLPLDSAGEAGDDLIDHLRTALHDRDERIRQLERDAAAQATELLNVKQAIETRDVIGMAMGIIIANLGCTPPDAFAILVKRSQNQNRKLHELCVEIVDRAGRRANRS